MFIELAFGIDDEAALVTDTITRTPDRPKVHTRAGAAVSVCHGAPAWPFRDGVAAALRARGTNMPVHNTQCADMNATYHSILDEMTSAEENDATGAKKQQIVIEALTAAGWVDDNNHIEIVKYIKLIAWIAKRPELLIAINRVKRASSKCCISV